MREQHKLRRHVRAMEHLRDEADTRRAAVEYTHTLWKLPSQSLYSCLRALWK